MKKRYQLISLSLIIFFTNAFASQWYEANNASVGEAFVKITSRNGEFNQLFAIGENGGIYRSWDGGHWWDPVYSAPERLRDIEIFYDNNLFADVIMVVGENGYAARSIDFGDSWQENYVGVANFTSVLFNENYNVLYVADENGTIQYSSDYGALWATAVDLSAGLHVVQMINGTWSVYLLSVENDSSFVHEIDPYDNYLYPDSYSIPNFKARKMIFRTPLTSTSTLYLLGDDVVSGETVLFSRLYTESLEMPIELSRLPGANYTDFSLFSVFDDGRSQLTPVDIFWLSTDKGEIFESMDLGITWNSVYQHPSGQSIDALYANASGKYENGLAIGALRDFTIRYGFQLQHIFPYNGDQFSQSLNIINLHFSTPADLTSIKDGIHLTSNLSGLIPYTPVYNTFDSLDIDLVLERANAPGSVPGETWTIGITDTIRPFVISPTPVSIRNETIQTDFLPFVTGTLDYKSGGIVDTVKAPSTNYVTGFFNDDALLDVITFANSTLYILETDGQGNISRETEIFVPLDVNVDASLKEQLLPVDLNGDDRLDLIFYDQFNIYTILNQSSGSVFNFIPGGASYFGSNFRELRLIDFNHNRQPDVVILSNTLIIRPDISDLLFGTTSVVVDSLPSMARFEVADIDLDSRQDIIGVSSDGIYFYRSTDTGFYPYEYYNGNLNYKDLKLADLDLDKSPEIIAYDDLAMDIWRFTGNFNLDASSPYSPQSQSTIQDVIVQDFGGLETVSGDGTGTNVRLKDIALLTADSQIKIFENISDFGNLKISERTDKEIKTDITSNGLLFWARDVFLDILIFDKNSGKIQNILNDSWVPKITQISVENDGVHLQWEPFPTEIGSFFEYRVRREDAFYQWDYREEIITDISQTSFIDFDTERFKKYNYFVEVSYNSSGNDIVAEGPKEYIELVTYHNGPLSGVISDSIRGHVVQDSIVVATGQSLSISEGVEFWFDPGSVFDVYGQLDIKGSFQGMVEFGSSRDYVDGQAPAPWRGINLMPGTDTVSIEWFSIWGADIGINATGRPFKTYLGGISQNNVGIWVDAGSDATLENLLLDSNNVAMDFEDGSNAYVKNITAVNNENGIVADIGSAVEIKNSIIWNSLNNDVDLQGNNNVIISYSTIQRINGSGLQTQVNSSNPPLFQLTGNDGPQFMLPESPTIDAGDPADDFSQEPMPNGGRINQGVFGNTFIATQSLRQNNNNPYLAADPDLAVYVNQQYRYTINPLDDDGDAVFIQDVTLPQWLTYMSDNTISGTPTSADIGQHTISFTLMDYFGGVNSLSFTITVLPPLTLDAPSNLNLTAFDQAIRISFTMPSSLTNYDGTYIFVTNDTTVDINDPGVVLIDTPLTAGQSFQKDIGGLLINETYYVQVLNYYLQTADLFSKTVMGSVKTLAPVVDLLNSDTTIILPVNQAFKGQVQINNTGGGTLISKLSYSANTLTNIWFDIDTSQKVVLPSESVAIEYNLHPNKHMEEGLRQVRISVLNNSAEAKEIGFTIILDPVFDKFAPNVIVTAKPDTLVKQSAYSIHFYADDTSGYVIGEADEDSLYKHYRLFRGQPDNMTLIEGANGIQDNTLLFYPLSDGFYTLYLWATDAEGNETPQDKRTVVPFIVNATQRIIQRNRWHMLSIPRPVDVTWQNFVRDSLNQIYRWDNVQDKYLAIHQIPQVKHPMGHAVWVISKKDFDIDISSFQQAQMGDTLTTPIDSGWNQIGTPLTYVTAWENMTFKPEKGVELSFPDAVSSGLLDAGIHWYRYNKDGSSGYVSLLVDDPSEMAIAFPWRGYFLKSMTRGTLKYTTIAYDLLEDTVIPVTNTTVEDRLGKNSSNNLDLSFNISLKSDDYIDAKNIFGISQDGSIKNASEPPHMGSYNALYFLEDSKHLIRKMLPGFSAFDEVKNWNFVVESRNANKNHQLSWDRAQLAASGLYFYLVDIKKEKYIEMNQEDNYSFEPGDFTRDFILHASQDAAFKPTIIPAEFRLKQNYPNPFNPSTTIRFGVPDDLAGKQITIRIYNILGQEITELLHGSFDAGFHEVKWNGLNRSGQQVASGVYFYKLSSAKKSLTRKMILIR